jgi:hypothetical protein
MFLILSLQNGERQKYVEKDKKRETEIRGREGGREREINFNFQL